MIRFRLDKWWFGLPLLLRGPLMSLVVTCATDFVEAQVCLIVLILTGYALIQATARPWKAPILNWMDLFVSILLIQIATLSGLRNLHVSRTSKYYAHSLLVLLICTVCTMWFFLAIALVLELFYGLKAKDSAILRVFESRGQDLGEMLLAIARGLQKEEVSQATLQRVFDRMNNHDLSRLETSLELLLTGFMGLNTGLQVPSMNSTRWRIQERAIRRASVLATDRWSSSTGRFGIKNWHVGHHVGAWTWSSSTRWVQADPGRWMAPMSVEGIGSACRQRRLHHGVLRIEYLSERIR